MLQEIYQIGFQDMDWIVRQWLVCMLERLRAQGCFLSGSEVAWGLRIPGGALVSSPPGRLEKVGSRVGRDGSTGSNKVAPGASKGRRPAVRSTPRSSQPSSQLGVEGSPLAILPGIAAHATQRQVCSLFPYPVKAIPQLAVTAAL